MKAFGNKSGAKDSNLRWQRGIELGLQSSGLETRDDVSVCALGERVNAGIGPTGPVDPGNLSRYSCERRFELILNRVLLRLALPPGKGRAVVGDNQFQTTAFLITH